MMKLVRVGGAALIAALATMIVGTPANAAPTACPSGYACMWKDSNYLTSGASGRRVVFEYQDYDFADNYYYWGTLGIGTQWADNNATSVYNNGNLYGARWFTGANYADSGYGYYRSKGSGNANLAGTGYNDNISSGCFVSMSNCYAR